ncbi:hypothetical protein TruAng_005660 [Truncatella angustata]|nr:hypothetical protein TruAng_005660 [Truncatella angustata]
MTTKINILIFHLPSSFPWSLGQNVVQMRTTNDFYNYSIVLNVNIVLGYYGERRPISKHELVDFIARKTRTFRLYLCGGPGEQNPPDCNPEFNDTYLDDNDVIIFPDYRGTGRSTEIRNERGAVDPMCAKFMRLLRPQDHSLGTQSQLTGFEETRMTDLLRLFRQDNIVRDLEAIRKCLLDQFMPPNTYQSWSSHGQSYGGWITLSYLALYPDGLSQCAITGGLAPIVRTPVDVYRRLFQHVTLRNKMYYNEHPDDVARVKEIVAFLLAQPPRLPVVPPSGGILSARRFLSLGRILGNHSRWTRMHTLIVKMSSDIKIYGRIRPDTLKQYDATDTWGFERRPLYAVLHEAMYCRVNEASAWAAERAALELPEYAWAVRDAVSGRSWRQDLLAKCNTDGAVQIYFAGEMVFQWMFEEYCHLIPLRNVAENLAEYRWEANMYPESILQARKPIWAVSYRSDMHVDADFSSETANMIDGIQHAVLNTRDPRNSKNCYKASGTLAALEPFVMTTRALWV